MLVVQFLIFYNQANDVQCSGTLRFGPKDITDWLDSTDLRYGAYKLCFLGPRKA